MTYATLPDLIERAGEAEILQVADRDGDMIPDAAVISSALKHADNTVNAYVRSRYGLPLDPTPDIVRTWAVAIARYHLHREGPPDYVQADYRDAISALKDVARGAVVLPDQAGNVPPTQVGSFDICAPDPVFDDRTLRGWA